MYKFIRQTKLINEHTGERGNALTACLATIFQKKISELPRFEKMGKEESLAAFQEFVSEQGYSVMAIDHSDISCFEERPGMVSIVYGLSPRETMHTCVAWAGRIIHDPHPSQGDLAEIHGWLELNPTDIKHAGNGINYLYAANEKGFRTERFWQAKIKEPIKPRQLLGTPLFWKKTGQKEPRQIGMIFDAWRVEGQTFGLAARLINAHVKSFDYGFDFNHKTGELTQHEV